MRLEWQILAAMALDLLIGDPSWMPHPVRGIGWLAQRLEPITRRLFRRPRLAGIVTAFGVICITGLCAYLLLSAARAIHPMAASATSILLLYTTIAARSLASHSTDVYRALAGNNLPEARKRVAMIVGRDTESLDERGIIRAAVESVAESIVDGVTAPLFFAVIGGPVAAIVYRAVNTLDSTFGYKNDRYLQFGWASARLDDVANFIPARLTAPIVCLAAFIVRGRGLAAFRVVMRDAKNHNSPNSGFTEAAVAGALGVQLGGLNHYFGTPCPKPVIGAPLEPLEKKHIPRANALMLATTGLFLVFCLTARHMAEYLARNGGIGS